MADLSEIEGIEGIKESGDASNSEEFINIDKDSISSEELLCKAAESLLPNKNLSLDEQPELTLLALCVWGEARGECFEGKCAVASVVLNRYEQQSWFGKTITKVLLRKNQFSCFNKNDPNRRKMMSIKNTRDWRECVRAAISVYFGLTEDPTGGATHYCHVKSNPSWSRKLTKMATIDDHKFYS